MCTLSYSLLTRSQNKTTVKHTVYNYTLKGVKAADSSPDEQGDARIPVVCAC